MTTVNAADRFLPPWKFDGTVWPEPQSMVVKEDYQILGKFLKVSKISIVNFKTEMYKSF